MTSEPVLPDFKNPYSQISQTIS